MNEKIILDEFLDLLMEWVPKVDNTMLDEAAIAEARKWLNERVRHESQTR